MNKLLTMLAVAGPVALGATGALADMAVSATTDLNVRAGPGPQYPVVGVLAAGASTSLKGCLANSKWCSVADGWVYSDYLTGDFGGQQVVLTNRPADAQIAVVDEPDAAGAGAAVGATTGAIAGAIVGGPAGAAVGGVAGFVAGGAAGTVIDPPEKVRTYVRTNAVEPVYLDGEVVVGATLPENVRFTAIPDYDYQYVYVNGQPVLVDAKSRQIVYVVR